MNIGGDDKNVFPYVSDSSSDRTRIDVSKVDQWETVFQHATEKGFFLHFKTQETENELLLDGGNLGTERKLYYRELIARFSHHLALNWNLGEETNDASTAQKQSWAQYLHDHDPYQHHIVIHNGANHFDLLGDNSELTGFSLQTHQADFSTVHANVLDYLDRSAAAGKPWAVAADEPGDAQNGIRPDNDPGNSHVDGRKNALWGTLMAGGWGNEWYFGYGHEHSDLTLNDFRSRDDWWDNTKHALDFFNDHDVPFWEMESNDSISTATNDYGFVKEDDTYVVYLKNGGTTNLNLTGATGMFVVQWFDPRNGGPLQAGSVQQVQAGGFASLGQAPNSPTQDWAILVTKDSGQGPDGDFNDDGLYNCTDIDTLTAAIAAGTHEAAFDLGGDGIVDLADRDLWLAEAGAANLSSGQPYLPGDADLSGVVDFLDYNIWAENRFTNSDAWCRGDFNASGVIDLLDLNIWSEYRFQGSPLIVSPDAPREVNHEAAAVSEPELPATTENTAALPTPSRAWSPTDLAGQKRTPRQDRSDFQQVIDQIWAAEV